MSAETRAAKREARETGRPDMLWPVLLSIATAGLAAIIIYPWMRAERDWQKRLAKQQHEYAVKSAFARGSLCAGIKDIPGVDVATLRMCRPIMETENAE